MKFIDQSGLIDLLEGKTNHSFCSLETETEPKLNQTGRETKETIYSKFGCSPKSIKKVSSFTAMLGLDYKHVIESRLQKEGKDISSYDAGTSWHIPVHGTKNLRQHKTSKELYAYIFCVSHNKPLSAYYDMEHGKMIDKDELKEFLPKESTPTNQGLESDNEVIVRTYKLASIRKIKIDSETYNVK